MVDYNYMHGQLSEARVFLASMATPVIGPYHAAMVGVAALVRQRDLRPRRLAVPVLIPRRPLDIPSPPSAFIALESATRPRIRARVRRSRGRPRTHPTSGGSPRLRMCGTTPRSRASFSQSSSSYPLSRQRLPGRRGPPDPCTRTASRVAFTIHSSCTFAPVSVTATGTPRPSVRT